MRWTSSGWLQATTWALVTIGIATTLVTEMKADEPLILVDQGIRLPPIAVSTNATPMIRRAAEELADYFNKVSGSRPPVIEGVPNPLPDRVIWVGMQSVVKSLFPNTDFDLKHPEEILLVANDHHLAIVGRDRWDPQRMDIEGREGKVIGKQQEYGTVNAVYTFIQDRLGVRWLWPGELGEDVLPQKSIRLAPFEYRYHPPIRSRGGVFNFSTLGNKGYGRSHDWTRVQRLQLHSLDMSGGHGFGDWWDRFHDSHPDYFALQPDGSRSGHPNPRNAKLCESNPAVWQQWLADVAAQIARDPTQSVFNASPNDGWASGHCVCENCRAWDHPDGEPRLFHWEGHRATMPALTDRDVTFANRLGALLNARYPDQDYRVLMLSYGHSRPAPIKAVPADNVIISSVANFLGRTHLADEGSPRGTTHRQQFEAWTQLARHLIWRPNTGSPAGWQQGLPDLSIAQTIEDFRMVASSGCLGIYVDGVWEHWATLGPQYYVMAQLTWNASQDGRTLLDDYYRRGFGPAAASIQRYYEVFEQARMAYVAEHGYASNTLDFGDLYTSDLLAAAEAHLNAADRALAPDAEIFRRRLAFLRTGFAYTQLFVDNARLMNAYWSQPSAEVAAQSKQIWQQMEQVCKSHPMAINWPAVRPGTPRMAGLHPDYPNSKLGKAKPNRKPTENDLDLN